MDLFKKSIDLSALNGRFELGPGGRPRGMSIFDDLPVTYTSADDGARTARLASIPMSGPFTTSQLELEPADVEANYMRALNRSNIVGGVPTHEEIMEGYA